MNETILRLLFFRRSNACNFNRQNTLKITHVGFNLHTLPARAQRELGGRRLPRFSIVFLLQGHRGPTARSINQRLLIVNVIISNNLRFTVLPCCNSTASV